MESGDEMMTKPTSPPETSRPGRLRVVVWNIARNPQAWPLNIAFVRDRSASMYGHKLHLAREAVLSAIRSLRDGDRFSVVACDHEVDLAAGWLASCGQVAKGLDEAAVT